MTIFSFNKHTPVALRHRLIRQFQTVPQAGRAAVCVTTFHCAAVGITLTAASRVVLMEPTMDPALEAQAAGRIHRLGQTKEVLIKRFAMRDTAEEAIVDLHAAQRAGALSTRDMQNCGGVRSVTRNVGVQKVPAAILSAFQAHGVDTPHRLPTGPGATTDEPVRKDTGTTRYDPTTYYQETVWEWFVVQSARCLDCGEHLQLSGKCVFRGLASERAAKESEIERCERRLQRVAEYTQRLTTFEYRSGRKQLTELQQAEVDREDEITSRLEELNDKMVGQDGVEYYNHPTSAGQPSAGGARFGGHSMRDSSDDDDDSDDDGYGYGQFGYPGFDDSD